MTNSNLTVVVVLSWPTQVFKAELVCSKLDSVDVENKWLGCIKLISEYEGDNIKLQGDLWQVQVIPE